MSIHQDLLNDFGDLSDDLRALRDELCVAPNETVRAAHLAAMDRAVTELVPEPLRLPRRRVPALALAAAATVGVLGLTGGLAAAGGLPAPVQHQAARVAGAIGWDIPDHSRPTTPTTPSSTPTAPTTARPSTTSLPSSAQPIVPAPQHAPASEPGAASTPALPTPSAEPPAAHAPPTATNATAPGSSGVAPGHQDPTTVPGAPGHSGAAPGQTKRTTATTAAAPGKSGAAPGHNKN
jgi:hypothetical protein